MPTAASRQLLQLTTCIDLTYCIFAPSLRESSDKKASSSRAGADLTIRDRHGQSWLL